MTFLLRFVTSNIVTRSFYRPTLVSASRFLTIDASNRSYTTMPEDDFFDQSWVRNLCPKISSIRMYMSGGFRSVSIYMRNDEDYVRLKIPDQKTKDTEFKTLLAQGKTHKECFLSGIKFPDKTDKKCCLAGVMLPEEAFKEEIKDGVLNVSPPNIDDIMANITANIITSFRNMRAKRGWAYYDMFSDRSILGEGLCPIIAMLSPINSFSIYKKETDQNLYIGISMPGEEKMKLTMQGLRVSLKIHVKYEKDNPKREDVKAFFDYDTFFIEAKSKTQHFITGIRLPEGIHKKHNMIRRKMKDGVFYAFLPCVKKEETKVF